MAPFPNKEERTHGQSPTKNEDLHKGSTLSSEKRMGKEDGGLARHTVECQSGVDGENAEIVARERGLKRRKVPRRNRVTTTETWRNESP